MNPFSITHRIAAQPLSAADDEGAGGGSTAAPGSSEQAEPDRLSKLESRLDRLGQGVEALLQRDSSREKDTRAAQLADAQRRLDSALTTATSDLDAAEKALATALDEGDAAVVAKAQRTVAEKAAVLERTKADVDVAKQRLKAATEEKPKPAAEHVSTANLDAWKLKHKDWYGIDSDMTAAAHKADQAIRKAGVHTPGSVEYFDAIDRQVQAQFPDRLRGSPSGHAMNRDGRSTDKPGSTRIDASLAEGWRRMGIDMDDPKVAERMISHRSKLVDKGILPQRQELGRIYTR